MDTGLKTGILSREQYYALHSKELNHVHYHLCTGPMRWDIYTQKATLKNS